MSKKTVLHWLLLGAFLFAVGVTPAKSYQTIQLPFGQLKNEDGSDRKVYVTDACANGTGGNPPGSHYQHRNNAAYAVDFGVAKGTPVRAPVSGTIVFAGWDDTGYGYLIKIREGGTTNREHWLAHNNKLLVTGGDVTQGQVIALSGETGTPGAQHIHYHVQDGSGYGGTAVDVRGNLPDMTWYDLSDFCDSSAYDGYALAPAPSNVQAVVAVQAPESPSGPPEPLQESWFTRIWDFIAPYVTYNPIMALFMPSEVGAAGLEFVYAPVSLTDLNAIVGAGSSSATPGETIDVIEGADNIGSNIKGLLDIQEQEQDPLLQIVSISADMPIEYIIRVKVRNTAGDDFNMQRVCIDSWCPESLDTDHEYHFSMSALGPGNHNMEIKYRRVSDNNNWANADVLYTGTLYVSPIISNYASCTSNTDGAKLVSGSDCVVVTTDVQDLAPVNWADRSEVYIEVTGDYEAWAYESVNFLGVPRVIRSGQNLYVGSNISSIDLKPLSSTPPANPTGPFTTDANTVHLWHIDDWSVPTISDSVGSLTGNKVDQAAWITNDMGNGFDKALLFPNPPDGRGVTFPPMENICPFTWEAWIGVPSDTSGGRIAGQLGGGGNTGANKWLLYLDGKRPSVEFWSGDGSQIAYGYKEANNGFNYLMFTYDCANSLKLYLNNELVGETTTAGVWNTGATTFEIGSAEGIGRFYGVVDEVRISNIVRVPTLQWNGGLVPNGSFETLTGGWAVNWTRNNTNSVLIDTSSNGTHGSNSLHFVTDSVNTHALSSQMPVSYGSNYDWRSDVRSTSGSGEFGFYIDEYDSAHNWISGQWFGVLPASIQGTKVVKYTPTSSGVSYADLQYYMNANTSYEVYVDSVSFNLAPNSNRVTNGGFEYLLNGWADAWTSDNTTSVMINTASQGNEGTNSLRFTPTSNTAHAYGTRFPVGSGTYTWSQYVSTSSGTGEFSFFIDEYDANGNWISGQWKGGIWGQSSGVQSFTYTRSSSNVAFASPQFIYVGGTTFDVNVDSVSFSQ